MAIHKIVPQVDPYARFFRSQLAPLPEHVQEALLIGAQSPDVFADVSDAYQLHQAEPWPVETGYAMGSDGSARVFVLTNMPGVTPAMWAWWFGWHGSHSERYRLWHPQAHVSAKWADGRSDLLHYVGRQSLVTEYIGSTKVDLSIRFVSPRALGLDEAKLAQAGEVAICARGSLQGTPIDTGWLVHHLRPTSRGCIMRSRFWIGGANIRPRYLPDSMAKGVGWAISKLQPFTSIQASELLVHCSQEMNHLAAILPDLYETFHAKHAANQ